MLSHSNTADFELVCIIVNLGSGSKVLQTAKQYGISGGTVLLGRGTVQNKVLEFLALADVRKEIVLLVASQAKAKQVLQQLDEKFRFSKPNHGIAYTTPVHSVFGSSSIQCDQINPGGGADQVMYQAITVIVEKGNAEHVIDAATAAGSKGGTVINARGSGVHEVSKVLAMEIEPEKEMVLILSVKESTEAIIQSINHKLNIDEPGNGIIYVQDVSSTYGLRH